jgi:hypothetical protein
MKRKIVFQPARIFDGVSEMLRAREQVFVEGGVISEISARPPGSEDEGSSGAGETTGYSTDDLNAPKAPSSE